MADSTDSDFSVSKKLKVTQSSIASPSEPKIPSIEEEPVVGTHMEDYGDDFDYNDAEDEDYYSDLIECDDSDDNEDVLYKDEYALLESQFDKADLPTGVEVSLPSLIEPSSRARKTTATEPSSVSNTSSGTTTRSPSRITSTVDHAESSSHNSNVEGKKIDYLLELVQFKRFDLVDAFTDHHFANSNIWETKPPKEWAKRINKEWKSLTTDLPETIFVRVSETRMDLLRAVIVGPSGTPYHDGLFVFDCQFPPTYPNKPPLVHYYSGGLRINPNLYECGKVCLSLLGTWSGKNTENWVREKSTMLQVLVSIQALILNERPFFNEPGHTKTFVGPKGNRKSNHYSENVLILSLKTMIYTMRRPPEHFKDLVNSHFRRRGRDILVACKAYTEGAVVASDIKKFRKYNQAEEKGSDGFRSAVNGMINMLVACFSRIGASNCEEFRVDPSIC